MAWAIWSYSVNQAFLFLQNIMVRITTLLENFVLLVSALRGIYDIWTKIEVNRLSLPVDENIIASRLSTNTLCKKLHFINTLYTMCRYATGTLGIMLLCNFFIFYNYEKMHEMHWVTEKLENVTFEQLVCNLSFAFLSSHSKCLHLF